PAQPQSRHRPHTSRDATATTADAGPRCPHASQLCPAAVCGGTAVLRVSVLRDDHWHASALREELCPPVLDGGSREWCRRAVAGAVGARRIGQAWSSTSGRRLYWGRPVRARRWPARVQKDGGG